MDEEQILSRARQGDLQALEELCRREWQPVYRLVAHAVANRAEAEDLTQEVFLRAIRALDRYQETGAPFRAFLATIARNLIRTHWKTRRGGPVNLANWPELPGDEDGPEEAAIAAGERAQLRRALDALSPDYQTVLRLRLLDGRPTDEVAAIMRRSPGAVRVLQHRALTALRAVLQKGATL
ncbi:MAG TPA: sigma-70 family RNA polymerase sigma factor [Thermomicrobiaceae bacterium]|nr:sigma-70 family RNA polymerase sigma factor [Thermomicrobiaceae bacterium]